MDKNGESEFELGNIDPYGASVVILAYGIAVNDIPAIFGANWLIVSGANKSGAFHQFDQDLFGAEKLLPFRTRAISNSREFDAIVNNADMFVALIDENNFCEYRDLSRLCSSIDKLDYSISYLSIINFKSKTYVASLLYADIGSKFNSCQISGCKEEAFNSLIGIVELIQHNWITGVEYADVRKTFLGQGGMSFTGAGDSAGVDRGFTAVNRALSMINYPLSEFDAVLCTIITGEDFLPSDFSLVGDTLENEIVADTTVLVCGCVCHPDMEKGLLMVRLVCSKFHGDIKFLKMSEEEMEMMESTRCFD